MASIIAQDEKREQNENYFCWISQNRDQIGLTSTKVDFVEELSNEPFMA